MLRAEVMFPSTTPTDVTTGFFDMIADNIVVILAMMGIFMGVRFVLGRLRKARKGSI